RTVLLYFRRNFQVKAPGEKAAVSPSPAAPCTVPPASLPACLPACLVRLGLQESALRDH
ncbi:hypothetical protein FQN60_007177, partial [Etheostoma spectabile]